MAPYQHQTSLNSIYLTFALPNFSTRPLKKKGSLSLNDDDHVGEQNNAVILIISIIMQNLLGNFLLFSTATWPSHHMDANQE